MAELSEQTAMAQLQERLSSKYVDLAPDRIAAAVQVAHARFAGSRIRDFVPLLVERRARAELSSTPL